jgi:hypothetical protein
MVLRDRQHTNVGFLHHVLGLAGVAQFASDVTAQIAEFLRV